MYRLLFKTVINFYIFIANLYFFRFPKSNIRRDNNLIASTKQTFLYHHWILPTVLTRSITGHHLRPIFRKSPGLIEYINLFRNYIWIQKSELFIFSIYQIEHGVRMYFKMYSVQSCLLVKVKLEVQNMTWWSIITFILIFLLEQTLMIISLLLPSKRSKANR